MIIPVHSLSVVLPAYNEEAVIGDTLTQILSALAGDFEIIVVNDGSKDSTGAIVTTIMETERRVRMVTHERNRGYGSALATGFAAATKERTFLMDSDGQFDIADLSFLLEFKDKYDAVIGYRLDRKDSRMRKLNAWGWKWLIRWILDIRVRDVDCAFKLFPTYFLHQHPPEMRGAMISAELLYRLKQQGCTLLEIGVQHLPRKGGVATGASLRVILRAFQELFSFAGKCRREDRR